MNKEAALYVVCYDIPVARLRARLAGRLEDFGERIQYSVFECHLDGEVWARLRDEISAVMEGEEGVVVAYRVGGDWRARRTQWGEMPDSEPADVYVV